MPPLLFDRRASQFAHETWKANCGPHALAAACALPLYRVRDAIPDFTTKPWTTPSRLKAALVYLQRGFKETRGLRHQELPAHGLARIQWEGRWLAPGVPKLVAYGYTHWIAAWDDWVFDTTSEELGWIPVSEWKLAIDAFATREFEGWHVTHHYELTGKST